MTNLESILDRFRSFIYLRDVHAVEWFEDFDRLRSGCVSLQQFHRVFDTVRFHLNDDEFEILSKTYMEPNGRVNYRNFCNTVDDVFSNRDLEKCPSGTVTDARKIVTRTLGIDQPSDDLKYRALFAKLSHQISTLGVHIRESYEDFDHHNNGTVTQSQFFRAMPFRDLNPDELQLLVKRYADPILHDVNYRRLITDINCYNSEKRPSETFKSQTLFPHQLQSLKIKDFSTPPPELMKRFANHVREKRIRIKEFFKNHDPLNQGLMRRSKFEGTLTLFGFTFLKEDLEYLSTRYLQTIDSTEYDNYIQFCDDIVELGGVVEEALTADPAVKLTPELSAVLQRVRGIIIRFRINALPTLQDFDRLGRGYITKLQFHRALSTLRIAITNEELDLIASEYERENGIDFYKFVEDVDASHKQNRRTFRPIGTTRQSIEDVFGHTPTGDAFVTPEVADEMIHSSKRGLVVKVGEQREIGSLCTN